MPPSSRTSADHASRFPPPAAHPAPTPHIAANGVHWLPVPAWQDIPWLMHGFSTRKGGVSRAYCPPDAPGELNLSFTPADTREAVQQNRRLFVEAVSGNPETPLLTIRQIHSGLTLRSSRADLALDPPHKADGHITEETGLLLAVQTADCIPVLVADRKRRAVGAFHAGWRGTVKRIAEHGVGRMRLEFGSQPEDLIAAIGPGVGPCCYAVGAEVLTEFESQFSYAPQLFHQVSGAAPGATARHLDLIEANRRQLLDAGIHPDAIHVVGGCTSCHAGLFFSHRAEKGNTGRLLAVIGIRR